MIDHVSIAVSRLEVSAGFYEQVLAPLGLVRLVSRQYTAGFGKRYPEFWLNARESFKPIGQDTGYHICLRAPSPAAVEQFYQQAVRYGGRGDGKPCQRQAAMTTYFAAFIRDLDGNKIEAATF